MREFLLVAGLFLVAAVSSAQPRLTMDWAAMADRIVRQLSLQPGEKVLSVAQPGVFEDLLPHVRYAVMKAGGVDLGVIDIMPEPVPESWDPAVLQKARGPSVAAYRKMLAEVDAAIMMPGASPAHPVYAAMQEWLREGKGRTVHFHWVEGGSASALPGQPLPPRFVVDATYQRALLHSNYQAIGQIEQRFEAAMRKGEVRVTSPLGTNLRFQIGDRPVNRQDGDASAARAARGVILIDREIELPAGAIRVAPLEETIEGTIRFPPSQWKGHPVEGLELRFERGRVVEVTATSGKEWVEGEMTGAGEAGRSFRELALGFNPELAVPEEAPWIPYYGYGAGVVRLSLGDNSELGGKVRGGYVRWNFFTDTTVSAGDEVWVRGGKLVVK